MRFCIITPAVGRNDGQGRVNLEIAAEAGRRGHEVVFVTEQMSGLPAEVERKSIILRPPSWLPTRLLRDQLFAWRMRAALARDNTGHNALLANGFVTWARCDVNAVHFVHAFWLASPHHPWRLRRDARSLYARIYSGLNVSLEKLAFQRSKYIVAVSNSVARDLRRDHVQAREITVVANGVDINEFHPGPVERKDLGLPDNVKLALFAGDLKSPRENLDTALQALPMVLRLHLAVAGREEGTLYHEFAQKLGVHERVHFLGFRRDMPALMRAADLFVFPSRYEPWGLVLLEALAGGTAVVTARSAGGSELIGNRLVSSWKTATMSMRWSKPCARWRRRTDVETRRHRAHAPWQNAIPGGPWRAITSTCYRKRRKKPEGLYTERAPARTAKMWHTAPDPCPRDDPAKRGSIPRAAQLCPQCRASSTPRL